MKACGRGFISALLFTLVRLSLLSATELRIKRVGRYLYDTSGDRFYIKGVAFQKPGKMKAAMPELQQLRGFAEALDFIDPLADATTCHHAITEFKKLNINTIRIYSYDPKIDHSACMIALDKAGIYVIADISLPEGGSINRAAPTWDVNLLTTYIKQIDNLRKFPNILAFNIGNEIVTNNDNSAAGPFIKAAARDVKLYLQSVKSPALVAYTSADGKKFPSELARFLACEAGGSAPGLDLFGVNNFRWCGESSYEAAYEDLTLEFQGLTIAAFFSEFGCLTPGTPRLWSEVAVIFSRQMSDLWSGAVAYSYYPTDQGYGLVDSAEGKSPRVTEDFHNLARAYRRAKPQNRPKLSELGPPKQQCSSTNTNSFVITNLLPPEPNSEACDCVDQGAFSCQIRRDAPSSVIGELTDYVCNYLTNSSKPGDRAGCELISSSSSKGKYGLLSACSPSTKLNFAITQSFIRSGLDPKACSFAGNATITNSAPRLKTLQEVDQIAKKCFEINANKGLPRGESAVPPGTPQLTSAAYQQSISGARGNARAKSAGTSSKSRVHLTKTTLDLWIVLFFLYYFRT